MAVLTLDYCAPPLFLPHKKNINFSRFCERKSLSARIFTLSAHGVCVSDGIKDYATSVGVNDLPSEN